ncbi:ATP-binding protein [Streptomyces sp. SA15]|uniref:ATP-binding protein n=1 Tax=Streptomyces sp. SA15 TaxID=934019 RepID=UPI0027BB1A15|nr:ATP-binding protein [Streptomyces sp. SA15]
MQKAQWQLARSPRSAGRARVLLRTQLADWKIEGEVAHTAELLLSELVANSVQHARSPAGREIGVRFAHYDGRLRVEVADASNARPELRPATMAAASPSYRLWLNAGDAARAFTESVRRPGRNWLCVGEPRHYGDTVGIYAHPVEQRT